MAQRTTLKDFDLNNPIYSLGTVEVVTIDAEGDPTTTLATLYEDLTSDRTLENPQTLDSQGKWVRPVYVEEPVILNISGLGNAEDHSTGVAASNLLGTAVADAQTAANLAIANFELARREANRAAGFANLQLPNPLGSNDYVRGDGGSGYERRTPVQVRGDIGAVGFNATSFSSGGASVFISTDDAESNIRLNADRLATGNVLGDLEFSWDSTVIGFIRGLAGSDTVNKNNGDIQFLTNNGSAFQEVLRLHEEGGITAGTATVQQGLGTINLPSTGGYFFDGNRNSPWIYGSQVATTSGTSVTLSSSIPDWVTEIEIIFNGVSNNAVNAPFIRAGNGGVETTGYVNTAGIFTGSAMASVNHTDGWHVVRDTNWTAASTAHGVIRLSRWDRTEHLWFASGKLYVGTTLTSFMIGHKTFPAEVDTVQLVANGAFDAGEARVRYR